MRGGAENQIKRVEITFVVVGGLQTVQLAINPTMKVTHSVYVPSYGNHSY